MGTQQRSVSFADALQGYCSGSYITRVSAPSAALSICVSIETCTISASPWNSVARSNPALASLEGLSFSAPNSIVASSNATRLASVLPDRCARGWRRTHVWVHQAGRNKSRAIFGWMRSRGSNWRAPVVSYLALRQLDDVSGVGHVDHVAQLPVGTGERRGGGEVYGQRERRVERAGLSRADVDRSRVDLYRIARPTRRTAALHAAYWHCRALRWVIRASPRRRRHLRAPPDHRRAEHPASTAAAARPALPVVIQHCAVV